EVAAPTEKVGRIPARRDLELRMVDRDAVTRFYSDPEMARAIFGRMSEITVRDDSTVLRQELIDRLRASENPRGQALADALEAKDFSALDTPEIRAGLTEPQQIMLSELTRQGFSSLGVAMFSVVFADVLTDALGVEGNTAIITELTLALSIDIAGEAALSRYVFRAERIFPRGFLVNAARGMPRQIFFGGLTASALAELGMDTDSYLFDAAVLTGAIGSELGLAALARHLELAGKGRLAGTLKAVRIASLVGGLMMLADINKGMLLKGADPDHAYHKQLLTMAADLERRGEGMIFTPLLRGALGVIAPNNAYQLRAATVDERYIDDARALLAASGQAVEIELFMQLRALLADPALHEIEDPQARKDATARAIESWVAGRGDHDPNPSELLDFIELVNGREDFYSSFGFRFRGLMAIESPEEFDHFVEHGLMRMSEARLEEVMGEVANIEVRAEVLRRLEADPRSADAISTQLAFVGVDTPVGRMRAQGWIDREELEEALTEVREELESTTAEALLERYENEVRVAWAQASLFYEVRRETERLHAGDVVATTEQ
ncbi:MAG: hypothetical protein AAF658_14450, partial [Myxococcota bacterium]